MEEEEPGGQASVGPPWSLARDPRVRRQDTDRLVSVRSSRGTPPNRCATDVPESGPAGLREQAVEDHLLLRGSEASGTRRCKARAQRGAPIHPGSRGRRRRSVPGRLRGDGGGARVAVVRHAEHVPKGRLRNRCAARDERRSHEENGPAATRKETLIDGPGYSASRAGRSAGRSLSWHGRGRGFKSHPVHRIYFHEGFNTRTSLRNVEFSAMGEESNGIADKSVAVWRTILSDPDVREWHATMELKKTGTADERGRVLFRDCKALKTDPSSIIADARDLDGGRRAVERKLQN